MSRDHALEQALQAAGGVNKVAKQLGISPQAVSQWATVPEKWALRLAQLGDWKVLPHRLRGDMYPNPSDGLPQAMREQLERAA